MGKIIDIKSIIDAGGYTEENQDSGNVDLNNLQIYTTESGKKTLYPNYDAVPKPNAGVTLNTETGEITVDIPDKWKDDEQVKKYIDNYMLKNISGNYINNKDVQYQDPFDETKQIKTEEWIKKLNDALQFQVAALNATGPTKESLIPRYGGTDEKNKVISGLTTDDVIIMSSKFDEDDSWVPMPAYMLLAYPEIENLESYTNGWVKKKDFMDNLYNIEDGKITEANAYGIATTPEKMLAEIEDMTPEEVAKTIAFGNFIHQVDPKRSNWQQFLQAGDALHSGFTAGTYDWFVETSDLITGIVSLSWITGEPVDTRGFWNGLIGNLAGRGEAYDVGAAELRKMEDMALTNKDALSKAQAGYVQGRLAGQAVDTIVSMVAVGEATKALSNFITTRITSGGAVSIADKMAKTSTAVSSSTALTTPEVAEASSLANMAKNTAAFKNAAAGSGAYQTFFKQTLGGALDLYSKSVSGATVVLGTMDAAKFASVVNSAARIATAANFANTAVSVLGNMVFAAVVGNKELTTKVLTSNATSDEAKTWLQQMVWETGEITALSYATNLAVDTFGRPLANSKAAEWVRNVKQKASQKFTGFTERVSTPWLNFMQWYNNNRAAAAKATTGAATNARAAQGEAIKEAVLGNEARAYGAHVSTEPGSYGARIVEEALRSSGVRPGVTMSETLENLARAGIVFDPANLNLSEYEAWQSNMAGLRVAESNWGAVDENISQVVHEFSDPDIQPIISEQLSEVNKANSAMLKIEEAQGLLSKPEIKKNKGLLKEDGGYIYANHSKELSRYIVRGYELRVIANEGRALGHQNLEEYKPYVEARTRLEQASKGLAPRLREIADKEYVPALANAERNIIDVMMNDGVYPRAFVKAMRASGKFGTNGKDWLRLVARQDTPKGAYTPFSGTVKEDNTISINKFRVLDDEDITWPGNGLQKLIEEYGISRAEKALVKEGKQATGKTTEVVVSGEKTRSAGLMKEFKGNFLSAVKQGIKSFVQTASGTVAIGKTRSAEQSAFLKEVADIGGVETIDIDSLRAIMKEKGLPMAEDILDQESLDKFLSESSEEARKLIIDAVGEKMGEIEITEETFPGLMGNETVQKILRGELEKTSLQTGYGIKDTRARLNAQVPGFDVLDWSLLGREHVDGLVPGGFYHNHGDSFVKAYIMDLKDLRTITGLNKNTEDLSDDAIKRITKDVNVKGGEAVIPIHFDIVSGDDKFFPQTRWGHSGDRFPDWETYFNYLESLGVTKVPVAINFSKRALAHKAILGSFVDKIDKAIATGKRPDVTMEEVAIALREFGTKDRVIKRLRDSAPEEEYPLEDIRKIVEDAEKYNAEIATDSIDEKFDDSLISSQADERLRIQNFFNDVNAKDITSDVQKAFSEYGKLPFFHGQRGPLGSMEYNDTEKVPHDIYRGAGDAYWLAPNASYVNQYGSNRLAGTIPVESFMSDREKANIIQEIKRDLGKIDKEIIDKTNKIYTDTSDWLESKLNSGGAITKRAKELYENGSITESEQIDILASDLIKSGSAADKKKAQKYKSIKNILAYDEYSDEDIKNVASGKFRKDLEKYLKLEKIVDSAPANSDYSPKDIQSYRALAEYTGKPVIDISEDGFADGTAFFYYKGVDPKFDEEIGKQLEAQAMAADYQLTPTSSKEFVKWAKNTTVKDIFSLIDYKYGSASSDVMKLEQIFEDADKLKGAEKKKFINSKKEDIAKIDESLGRNMAKDAMKWDEDSRITDSFGKIDRDILGWINSNINKPSVYNNSILNRKIFNAGIDGKWLESTMKDAEYSPLQAFEIRDPAVTEEKIAEWNAIDPRNIENVPTDPEFKQPGEVSYRDYERGLAEDAGLNESILEALRGEQFNKLSDLKNTNNREYEDLLDKLDRANAKVSDDVKQSGEVQVAAEEYRKNIRDFENAVLFNQKFSYMIKAQTSKNTMTAFAEENGITLPEGKGSAKSKMKSALWQMLVDGKELPAIKGLKKTDVKNIRNNLEIFKDTEEAEAINKQFKKNFYKMLDETDLFKNAGGPNPLKYELDEEAIYNDIDEAIGDMITRIKLSSDANAAIEGIILNQGYQMSDVRYEFTVLDQILSKEMKKELSGTIKELSRKIVDNLIPKSSLVIKGNIGSLYEKVEAAIDGKLKARFATAKTTLESMGEEVESATITQLLEEYNSEIKGASEDPTVIKTMDENGEIQYERVSPTLASIYNERPTYSPMSTPMKILNNLAILKKINQTDFSPRSFAKQTVSDPAMAFATVGALPGTLHAIRDEIASHFGPSLLRAMEKSDPLRFNNIKAIADREGISMEEAFKRNSEAIAKTQVPFTLLNNELLRQAKISKFGNDGMVEMNRRKMSERINDGLRKVSDKLGFFQNKRETYVRLYSGEKAFMDALRKGYNLEQAENFREYALNTATTNFRTKHSVFNMLRSTVPYLTSGISGAKSFWQMFELDPIGVTSRIFSGFVAPILYFAGEIFSDENLKKKYEALAESEKENHIVIAIGGELVLIPVGEEIGQYTNVVMHAVENMYNENQYDFWNLMLNDLVSFIPGADFTGFTDPEMWGDLSGEAPTFLEVAENGIAKMLSGTMPPVVQSAILAATGRDLYTGRKMNNSYITIDEEGNPVLMSNSQSQFAKTIASVVGGDARVIERVVSGTIGTVALHTLDVLTSAAQFVGSQGGEGSLTTVFDKTFGDLSAPFAPQGYNELDRRLNYAISALYDKKESIQNDKVYIKYNQDIASEKDPKKRQNLINKRNGLFSDYIKKVEALIKGYKAAGGTLDKWKFSKAVSLITFEDAVRADRQFMDINTNYSDAYKQAMQTLYDMGITNPDGPSSLGYIYTDDDGKPQLKMWTPTQMQIIQNQFHEQGNIHAARINAIIDDGTANSLKKQRQIEGNAEQPYWDKYNATGKLSNAEWDAIDDLRKSYNAAVVLGLKDYMNTYGATNVLSNDKVIEYLKGVIKVPSAYETIKGRYISSENGKLDKQSGFAESYIKTIFGVK